MIDGTFWNGKRVLVTGHSGFIGGWLSAWLHSIGAEVIGFSLDPPTEPSFFEAACLARRITSLKGDIRSPELLSQVICDQSPDIILHLAAQPLVFHGRNRPVETFETNVGGTVNVLEQAHQAKTGALVIVSTDKVYDSTRARPPFREHDPIGSKDVYGASKVCGEFAVEAYADRFSADGIVLAIVRAGNAIGGGDWAPFRLVPDVARALQGDRHLCLRQPLSVRPWQHALDMVAGILCVAQACARSRSFIGPWNIGPPQPRPATAQALAELTAEMWGGSLVLKAAQDNAAPEADVLSLDTTKARREFGLQSPWSLRETVGKTVEWYKAAAAGADMWTTTLAQIQSYCSQLPAPGQPLSRATYHKGSVTNESGQSNVAWRLPIRNLG
jgi:CDP-glucose 4,6-dehydratase